MGKNKNRNKEQEVVVEATTQEQEVVVEAKTTPINVEALTGTICFDVIVEAKRDFISVEALAKSILTKYTEANITLNKKGRAVTEERIRNTINGIMRIVKENRVYTGNKKRRFGDIEFETKVENNIVLVKFITKQKDTIAQSLQTGEIVVA